MPRISILCHLQRTDTVTPAATTPSRGILKGKSNLYITGKTDTTHGIQMHEACAKARMSILRRIRSTGTYSAGAICIRLEYVSVKQMYWIVGIAIFKVCVSRLKSMRYKCQRSTLLCHITHLMRRWTPWISHW